MTFNFTSPFGDVGNALLGESIGQSPPPQLEITICDFKFANCLTLSCASDKWNMARVDPLFENDGGEGGSSSLQWWRGQSNANRSPC
jgi:hypothetical protein